MDKKPFNTYIKYGSYCFLIFLLLIFISMAIAPYNLNKVSPEFKQFLKALGYTIYIFLPVSLVVGTILNIYGLYKIDRKTERGFLVSVVSIAILVLFIAVIVAFNIGTN